MTFQLHLDNRPSHSPLPSWSKPYTIGVGILKHSFNGLKDSVKNAQNIVSKLTHPKHYNVVKKSLWVPRRIGTDKSPMKAEYLDWSPSLSTQGVNVRESTQQIVLFAHGGAFTVGSRKTHRGITSRLCQYSKCRVLSIDYRLSPQYPFPAAFSDFLSAYLYLIDPRISTDSIKYDPKNVIFCGDSAGGNLAMASTLWLRDRDFPLPGAILLFSPWLDLSHSMPSFVLNHSYDYVPDGANDPIWISEDRIHYYTHKNELITCPFVSPLYGKGRSDRPLPPTLIQVGDAEKLRDESLLFQHRFPESPIHIELYQDLVHDFHMLAALDKFCHSALKRACEFVKSLATNNATRKCEWIQRRSDFEFEINHPIHILQQGRDQLKDKGLWSDEKEKNFISLYEMESKDDEESKNLSF